MPEAQGSTACAKEWFTANEIAGLAGAPTSERGVNKAAARDAWKRRRRTRGKGFEFHMSTLPAATREAISLRAALESASTSTGREGAAVARRAAIVERVDDEAAWRARQAGTAKAAGISGRARERMDARISVLTALDQFAAQRGVGICKALDEFASAYASGELYLPIDVRNVIGFDVSPATLRRWQRTLRTQGAAGLAGEYGKRAGTGAIETDEELREFVLGMLVERPHLNSKLIYRAICARFKTRSDLPILRTVQRFLSRWKTENAQLFTAVANPDAWKNRFMVAHGSASEGITRINQRWEFDSTPADVLLKDGRYSIIGVIDVYSRRAMLYVSKTSSATGVCGAIRRAILDWGVLEEAKLDNGQDYVSHRVQRVFASLGVRVQLSAPFSPWQKPHIERFFRTFSHDVLELLPGYAGHNVADAQALRASKSFADRLMKKGETVELKLTAAELQRFCDEWCSQLYAHEPRQALDGDTVFERVAASRTEIRRIGDERVLDHLLAEAPDGHGRRTVTKKGIRVDGYTYSAPELWPHVGEPVRVLYDERDLGRIVVYRDEEFVCIATCPEIEGVSRAEVAAVAREQQKAGIEEARRQIRASARKQKLGNIAAEILDSKRRDAETIAAFPPPNVLHLTPAIEAAQAAANAEHETPIEHVARETTIAEVTVLRDLARAEQSADETAESRFRQALAIELKAHAGAISEFEQAQLARYQGTSEYRARRAMFAEFGPELFQLGDEFRALLPEGFEVESTAL
jgi:putative transposase